MKKGFTLIELLVYIALLGIIVLVAGQAFSDSTVFRVRTQSMLESSENAAKVAAIFKEDLSQMGAKSWKVVSAAADDQFNVDSKVYMDPSNSDLTKRDSSSYVLRSVDNLDSIAFRKMEYKADGDFLAVRGVAWYVKDSVLWRICQTLSGTGNDDCPVSASAMIGVKMADKVARFDITPATPGIYSSSSGSEILFPASSSSGFRLLPREVAGAGVYDYENTDVNPEEGSTSVVVSGFTTNFDGTSSVIKAHQVFLGPAVTAGLSGTWNSNCTEFTFIPRETYAFEFRLLYAADNMRMFQPNKDHIAVGLRAKADASLISGTHDFMIYPPQVSDASAPTMLRYGEFSVLDTVKACFAITFAFYSPVANTGTLTFQNFKVYRKTDEAYHFESGYNPTDPAKKSLVKAFQLDLDVKRRGETGRVTMVIPTANNGVAATATAVSSSSSP